MGVGRGGLWPPLDFEIISKKRLFFQFRGVKTKFHRFMVSPWKKFWENPVLAPPWKKSFRRPWSLISEKIIIGSLESEKIGSLESEKSGPCKSIPVPNIFLKKTLVQVILAKNWQKSLNITYQVCLKPIIY